MTELFGVQVLDQQWEITRCFHRIANVTNSTLAVHLTHFRETQGCNIKLVVISHKLLYSFRIRPRVAKTTTFAVLRKSERQGGKINFSSQITQQLSTLHITCLCDTICHLRRDAEKSSCNAPRTIQSLFAQ